MITSYGVMFKAEMIRAYMEGRKTQTRRLNSLKEVNKKPNDWRFMGITERHALFQHRTNRKLFHSARLPYGDTSCTLWFRETWRELIDIGIMGIGETTGRRNYVDYKADSDRDVLPDLNVNVKWVSAMLMPKWASRFPSVPILKVRVERLWDISEHDAKAEGVQTEPPKTWIHSTSYRESYCKLWDEINGQTFPWALDPWVFVYEFQKYKRQS